MNQNDRLHYSLSLPLSLEIDGVAVRAIARKSYHHHSVELLEPYRVKATGTFLGYPAVYAWKKFVESPKYTDSETFVKNAFRSYRDLLLRSEELREKFRLFLPQIRACRDGAESIEHLYNTLKKCRKAACNTGLLTWQTYERYAEGLDEKVRNLRYRCDSLQHEWFLDQGLEQAISFFGEQEIRELITDRELQLSCSCAD